MNFNGKWKRIESGSEFTLSGPYGIFELEYTIEYYLRMQEKYFKAAIEIHPTAPNNYIILGGTVFGHRAKILVLTKKKILINDKYLFEKKYSI